MAVEIKIMDSRAHNGVVNHSAWLHIAQLPVAAARVKQAHVVPLLHHHVHDAWAVVAIRLSSCAGL